MGLLSGLIAQGTAELIGMSKSNKMHSYTIKIVEKHREFLKSKDSKNFELEEFIEEHKKFYNKQLKKIK